MNSLGVSRVWICEAGTVNEPWFFFLVGLVIVIGFLSMKKRAREKYALALIAWDERLKQHRGYPGTRIAWTRSLRAALRAKHNDECGMSDGTCDGPLAIDHITAIKIGGNNYSSNLQLLCRGHNSQKGERTPLEVEMGVRVRRDRKRARARSLHAA